MKRFTVLLQLTLFGFDEMNNFIYEQLNTAYFLFGMNDL